MFIKEAAKEDLDNILRLYTHLHDNPYPAVNSAVNRIWNKIISDENYHIIAGYIGEKLVTSCSLIIIENLTHQQRPYALIENVITHPDHRGKGYASQILSAAKAIGVKNNCYKIMLMTGSKEESTLRFYKKAGFNTNDKIAFILWL